MGIPLLSGICSSGKCVAFAALTGSCMIQSCKRGCALQPKPLVCAGYVVPEFFFGVIFFVLLKGVSVCALQILSNCDVHILAGRKWHTVHHGSPRTKKRIERKKYLRKTAVK
jgi:hypothetical protein